ncbi:hypothetical protein CVS47_03033 [Microbacterium lemovicicum]|uniref:Uncharacterized protein n=1 Tax=Microbacterium lemovicicum TaxID=1072463 RepID=A0A3Q9J2D4_9MICO|nr:hypothetical protein CVS47_03033 [Microbacterium lemovicicum]
MSVDDDAELARLRRRAYGPDADIAADPVALARLDELEQAARPQPEPERAPEPDPTPAAAASARLSEAPVAAAVVPGPSARPRAQWHLALIAGVGVLAVLMAASAWRGAELEPVAAPSPTASVAARFGDASPFSGDPTARVLQEIPVDDWFGDYFDLPSGETAPPFPVPEAVRWSAPLGDFYGGQLWLARSSSGLPCLAVVLGDDVRADCRPAQDFDRGALVVTVPYSAIPAADRPPGMTPTESLGYQWLSDQSVTIVAGRTRGLGRD